MNQKMRVGFIGIGMMGKPMSKRVLASGYPLTVYDIRSEPVAELVGEGAKEGRSPKEVAEVSDVVLTSLPTLTACEEVYFGSSGLLKGAREGVILVETSTVPPNMVRRYYDEAKKQGVFVTDVGLQGNTLYHPESAGLKGNEIVSRGIQALCVGGDPDVVERVRPVLATIGDPIIHFGPVGSGMMIKVLSNAIVHASFLAICEAFAVAAKSGIDIKRLHEHMTKTSPRGHVVEHIIPHYLESGIGKMMRIEVATKDAESMLQLGHELGVPLPIHSIKHAYFALAQGFGLKDCPWDEMLKMWEDTIGKSIRFD